MRTRSPRREKKTKRWPLRGSCRKTSRTSTIRLSAPLRPSIGWVATERRERRVPARHRILRIHTPASLAAQRLHAARGGVTEIPLPVAAADALHLGGWVTGRLLDIDLEVHAFPGSKRPIGTVRQTG